MSDRQQARAVVAEHGPTVVCEALLDRVSNERRARIEEVLDARLASLTIVLENLYDPHNGAAALRSIEAFGLASAHVIEAQGRFRAEPTIAVGSEKWVELHRHGDAAAAAADLRARGMQLVAAVPGERSIEELDLGRPTAVWFGNERDGLSAAALAACDVRAALPMVGFTRSFNLSVSVALCVAALAGRRRAALGRPGDLDDATRARLRAEWYAQDIRGVAEVVRRHVSKQTRP